MPQQPGTRAMLAFRQRMRAAALAEIVAIPGAGATMAAVICR